MTVSHKRLHDPDGDTDAHRPVNASRRTRKHSYSLVAAGMILAAAVTVTGCAGPQWQVRRIATTADLRTALGDFDESDLLDAEELNISAPDIAAPSALRPCCAFGTGLRVSVAGVPVPAFKLNNVLEPEKLGHHTYGAGLLSTSADPTSGHATRERNGLVYTCRGGFLDTAHIRDYADMTLYLTAQVARRLVTGGRIPLPDEGGKRAVILQPTPASRVLELGQTELATAIGQWLAFQVSIWHETATWFGYSAMGLFPERASAFSPEDLYSNLLGTKLVGGIILAQAADTTDLYNAAVDDWMGAALVHLGAVDKASTGAAIVALDGVWWNSKARLPQNDLVLRRYMHTGEHLSPWLATDAYTTPKIQAAIDERCEGMTDPLALENSTHFHGVSLADLATLEITPPPRLVAHMPIPQRKGVTITQADFPRLISIVHEQANVELGEHVAEPQRADP